MRLTLAAIVVFGFLAWDMSRNHGYYTRHINAHLDDVPLATAVAAVHPQQLILALQVAKRDGRARNGFHDHVALGATPASIAAKCEASWRITR